MCGDGRVDNVYLFVSNTGPLCEWVHKCVILSLSIFLSLPAAGVSGEEMAAETVVHWRKAYWTIKTEAEYCPALCGADWIRETDTHSSSSQDIAGNYP